MHHACVGQKPCPLPSELYLLDSGLPLYATQEQPLGRKHKGVSRENQTWSPWVYSRVSATQGGECISDSSLTGPVSLQHVEKHLTSLIPSLSQSHLWAGPALLTPFFFSWTLLWWIPWQSHWHKINTSLHNNVLWNYSKKTKKLEWYSPSREFPLQIHNCPTGEGETTPETFLFS